MHGKNNRLAGIAGLVLVVCLVPIACLVLACLGSERTMRLVSLVGGEDGARQERIKAKG